VCGLSQVWHEFDTGYDCHRKNTRRLGKLEHEVKVTLLPAVYSIVWNIVKVRQLLMHREVSTSPIQAGNGSSGADSTTNLIARQIHYGLALRHGKVGVRILWNIVHLWNRGGIRLCETACLACLRHTMSFVTLPQPTNNVSATMEPIYTGTEPDTHIFNPTPSRQVHN
jgi:hypothetical protein